MKTTLVSAFGFIILILNAIVWATPVPDTGQIKCYNANVEIPCPSSDQPFYGQDAQYTINPMSFTKLDGSGNVLSDSATSWVMVKDNVTGLVWESKTNKDGVENYNDPHDADNTYTWYDSNPATNGGNAGTPGTGTDTEDFVKALNDARYGGYSDWRMPTIKELAYIVNYSIPYPGPTIDTGYFPNTVSSFYWSSTTGANNTSGAWGVPFNGGDIRMPYKDDSLYVRAVRGGQSGLFANLVISPASRNVAKDAGTTTFSASNTGTGTMPWTAAVTSGGTWLSITSGASGTDTGTINCSFTANTSALARTATIRVTATGATGSPVDVTVTQTGSFAGSLAVSFDSLGFWIYNLGSAAWMQLSSLNPENMISSGSMLYVDFGASYGLYKWDGAAWTQLTTANPENMVASGSTLYVDFGVSYGLSIWDGAAWTQLTSANPENMVASGSGLYVDFGTLGLYYWNGAAWSQLTGSNPAMMAILN